MINMLNDLHKVSECYEGLKYDLSKKQIYGTIFINKKYNDEQIQKEYMILIDLSKSYVPYVYDCNKVIKKSYPHMYNDRRLCLATDMEQYIYLKENKSICLWIKKYVESYFFSYEYYKRYGIYPFGEYSHGIKGLDEYFAEYFKLEDINVNNRRNIIEYIFLNKYRGHNYCPCGSLKKIRDCHKNLILSAINDKYYQFLKDCYIKGALNEK